MIDKKYKLEEATSGPKDLRPILENIFVNKGHAIATNGKVLAMVPAETQIDEPGNSCSGKVLKAARKGLKKHENMAEVPLKDLEGKFPDITQVIPAEEANYTIGIDAKLLYALSQALGCDRLTLNIIDSKRAIKVRPFGDKAASGLIMPCKDRGLS